MKAQLLLIPVLLFFVSCSGNKNERILTLRVTRSDYVEKINIPGTVQAVVNTSVNAPNGMYGMMTVLKLGKDGSYVHKGDTICVLSSAELESTYKEELNTIEKLEADVKKAEADNNLNISLLEAQLATSEAQVRISSLDSLQLQYASDSRKKLLQLEMKKSLIEKQKIEKKLSATKRIGENDLRQKRARLIQEKMKIQNYAEQLSALNIIAKRDGVVQQVESPMYMISSSQGTGTYGGTIKEGSVMMMPGPVLQFPDLSKMQISADAAEAEFKKIEKGQKVFIRIDAAGKLLITGKVNRKSLSSSSSQRYSRSKVKTYEVIIDVDSCDSAMKPGLSAMCEIILREARDTLFIPSVAIFENDSSKIVYVMKGRKFIPSQVKTGSSGNSYTIITEGLKGNEIVALTQPPNSLILKEKNKADTTRTMHN
jgi:HlyD family secretion protein